MRHARPLMLALAAALCCGWASAESEARCSLTAISPEGEQLGQCPLKHTDVQGEISGFIGRVTVKQEFENPYESPIEAIYTFPLPEDAAVDRMVMHVGDRVIRGIIKEREEAREIYEQARAAGQRASLLDQERANIFTQSVANIMPGDAITIEISYVQHIPFEDGKYSFVFPMVVGPRYIPGAPSGGGTDQVPDAGRITPPVTPEGTRAGHDISLALEVDAGTPITGIASELHPVEIEQPTQATAKVRLKDEETLPNRDFILEYSVSSDQVEDAVLTHYDARGGFFTLVLHPPRRVAPAEARPKEMIFVIDRSGSMSGFPIEKAKETMRAAILGMNPNDTFNLISFSGGTGYCFPKPVANTEANRQQALDYLRKLEGGGGTEMMGAIKAALEGPYSDDRLRIVCFMTDGYIGNDMAIIDEIQRTSENARVFAFGIGNSVNRFLIEGMAREGRGASEIVTLESEGQEAAERFSERVQSPVLTDIELDFGRLPVQELYPPLDKLPDLFSAEPLVITGRYPQGASGKVRISGQTAQGGFSREVAVNLPEDAPEHDVLAPLWARKKIAAVMAQDWVGVQSNRPRTDVKEAVAKLGLEYDLMTQYTSFVAVEEKVVNEGGQQRRVQVPVEMPDGVSYEGVFGSDGHGGLGGQGGMAMGAQMQTNLYAHKAPAAMPAPSMERRARISMDAVARTRPMAPPPTPAAEPLAEAPVSAEEVAASPEAEAAHDAEALAKLDAALRALVEQGQNAPQAAKLKITDGKVEVVLKLNALEDEVLEALRKRGVEIITLLRSSSRAHARIPVNKLEAVAALVEVQSIAGFGA